MTAARLAIAFCLAAWAAGCRAGGRAPTVAPADGAATTRGPGESRSPNDGGQATQNGPRLLEFELTVDGKANPAILKFRYPDRPGRTAIVFSLGLGLVGGSMADSCHLHPIDLDGPLISGFWALGSTPPNYKLEDCHFSQLKPGEWEVWMFLDRDHWARRLRVAADGSVVVLPWEKPYYDR